MIVKFHAGHSNAQRMRFGEEVGTEATATENSVGPFHDDDASTPPLFAFRPIFPCPSLRDPLIDDVGQTLGLAIVQISTRVDKVLFKPPSHR